MLEYVGYLERMMHRRLFKKVLESKPEGRRRMGRPRLKWLDDIEGNLREMKVKRESGHLKLRMPKFSESPRAKK